MEKIAAEKITRGSVTGMIPSCQCWVDRKITEPFLPGRFGARYQLPSGYVKMEKSY